MLTDEDIRDVSLGDIRQIQVLQEKSCVCRFIRTGQVQKGGVWGLWSYHLWRDGFINETMDNFDFSFNNFWVLLILFKTESCYAAQAVLEL